MKKIDLINEEDKILFEDIVYSVKHKGSILLTITDKRIIFEKEKGLINKKYKVVGYISSKSIKEVNNKVRVLVHGNKVGISTYEGDYVFDCKDKIEANTLKHKFIYAKTGNNLAEIAMNKADTVFSLLKKVSVYLNSAISIYEMINKHNNK